MSLSTTPARDLIDSKEVARLAGSKPWNVLKDGRDPRHPFPAPINPTGRKRGWRWVRGEVEAYLEQLLRARAS